MRVIAECGTRTKCKSAETQPRTSQARILLFLFQINRLGQVPVGVLLGDLAETMVYCRVEEVRQSAYQVGRVVLEDS